VIGRSLCGVQEGRLRNERDRGRGVREGVCEIRRGEGGLGKVSR